MFWHCVFPVHWLLSLHVGKQIELVGLTPMQLSPDTQSLGPPHPPEVATTPGQLHSVVRPASG